MSRPEGINLILEDLYDEGKPLEDYINQLEQEFKSLRKYTRKLLEQIEAGEKVVGELSQEAEEKRGIILNLERQIRDEFIKRNELIHIGYTSASQIERAEIEHGRYWPDPLGDQNIPVYMLKCHQRRLELSKLAEEVRDDEPNMIEKEKTNRGFALGKFTDLYGAACSIQKSSLATQDAIWLGVDDADPKIMASQALRLGINTNQTTGWIPYYLPEEVLLTTRMHLNIDQVKAILPLLHKFIETGDID